MEFKGFIIHKKRAKICARACNICICAVPDNFAQFTHMLQHLKHVHTIQSRTIMRRRLVLNNKQKKSFLVCSQLPALIWASVQSLGCRQGKVTVPAGDCGYCSYKINNLPLAFTASTQSYPLNPFFSPPFLFLSWLRPQKRFQSRLNRNECFLCDVLCETWTQNSHWPQGASYVWRRSHAFLSFFLSFKEHCMKLKNFFSSESLARSQAGSTQCALWFEGCHFCQLLCDLQLPSSSSVYPLIRLHVSLQSYN